MKTISKFNSNFFTAEEMTLISKLSMQFVVEESKILSNYNKSNKKRKF